MTHPEPKRRHDMPAETAGAIVMRRLDELAELSSDPEGLTRLYLTPAHKAAALLVMGWMAEAGMTASIDAAGTVVGRLPGSDSLAKTIIIGSHIDTVRNAGRFDGPLGVIVAIQAMVELAARRIRLPYPVEVVAFGDEEGVRFPVTLTGSRALAGTVDPATLDVIDENEITLRQALLDFGCDPDGIAAVARRPEDIAGYLEVHIEQGPVLEAENLPVGIVTAINGASRLCIQVSGQAGHAGTVPMHLRRDAFAAAAEMALAVERIAVETPDLVATIGRVEVLPGAVNVIPGRVSFTLDVRSPRDEIRRQVVARLEQAFAAVTRRRGLGFSIAHSYDEAAAPCAPALIAALTDAVAAAGLPVRRLASGAGHDGLAIASLCPIGMLFVRCAGGISHNPAESMTGDDAAIAVDVLVRCLEGMSPA